MIVLPVLHYVVHELASIGIFMRSLIELISEVIDELGLPGPVTAVENCGGSL